MSDPILVFFAVNTVVSALMCGVALICRWGRVRPAIVAFWWLAALVKLVIPSVLPVPVLNSKEVATAGTPNVAVASVAIAEFRMEPSFTATPWRGARDEAPSSTHTRTSLPWRACLLGVWIAGSIAWCGLAVGRLGRFDRLVRRGVSIETGEPEVVAVEASISPLLWAFWGRARIVVPKSLFATLSDGERAAVIAHERCHYRRRDHWVRWIEFGVLAICWWHPLAWWISRRLREAEEAACDAAVVANGAEPRVYATALLRTALFLSDSTPTPRTATTIGSAPSIKSRVHSIMHLSTHRPLSLAGWTSLVLIGSLSVLGKPARTSPEPPLTPGFLSSPIPTDPTAEVDAPAAPTNDPVSEPANPEPPEVEKPGEKNAPNSAATEPLTAKPLPIQASNDITVSSHAFEAPEGGIRASIKTRFSDRVFALLADRVDILHPSADGGSGDVVTVRRGSTLFKQGKSAAPVTVDKLVFRGSGSVYAGLGEWRLIADTVELTTTTATATGEPVLLVDLSEDPPQRVFTARRVSYDIQPGTVTLTDSVEFLLSQVHFSGRDQNSSFSLNPSEGSFQMKGGVVSQTLHIPSGQVAEVRSRLLKTWPGSNVVDAQLAPLLSESQAGTATSPSHPAESK